MSGLLFVYYAVAFILIFILRRWVWLAVGAGVAVAAMAWLLSGLDGASGPATFGIALTAAPLGLGFIAGLVGRLIVNMLPQRWRSLRSTILVGFVSFIAAPLLAYGAQQLVDASNREAWAAPSEACLAKGHPAVLAGVPLSIPLAPAIRVGQGAAYEPTYLLDINQHARDFCAEAAAGRVRLTNLSFKLDQPHPEHPFCKTAARYPWQAGLCASRSPKSAASPLVELKVYAIGQYAAEHMLAYSVEEDAALDDATLAQLSAPDKAGVQRRDGSHDRIRVIPAGLGGRTGPYVAKCFESKGAESKTLYCQTAFRLGAEIGMIYGFRADDALFKEDAAAADALALSIWESLKEK